MTIKTKLIVNVLVTAAIVVSISFASFISMRFLQEKLAYLTEKSTPFQMRTIELQRELQSCITTLLKVSAAQNLNDFQAFKGDALKSLEKAAATQKSLEKISSNTPGVSDDLAKIARELFAASEERISSNNAAIEADSKVLQRMKESSARLKELEVSIRNLQINNSKAFSGALENTATFSGRLQNIEELRNLVRELQLISQNVQNYQSNTSVLIAKGKLKAIAARINKNEYFKANKSIATIVNSFSDLLNEYVRVKSAAITQKDSDSTNKAAAIGKDIPDKLGALFQTLDQETVLARDELAFASNKQGTNYSQSNSANSILVANSELAALGLTVTNEISRLFTLVSMSDLDKSAAEIRTIFNTIHDCSQQMETSLTKLGAAKELKILHAAHKSLEEIRVELTSASGIIATLKKKLNAIEQSNISANKLHTLVIKQAAAGNSSVSTAQAEQEKAIIAVNSMINRSLTQITSIGAVAIIIGIIFGFWIYRSILLPMRVVLKAVVAQQNQVKEQAILAEAVAGGDLSRDVIVSEAIKLDHTEARYDEMGMVLRAVVGMSEAQATLDRAFSGMTTSLRIGREDEARRDHLKNGLFELNKILRGEHETHELAENTLTFIANYLKAGVGIIYLYDEKAERLKTLSTYAISNRSKRLADGFSLGEGLPGQAALERKMISINSLPPDYLSINSALGNAVPNNVLIMPIMHNDNLVGVLELGSFTNFSAADFDFLEQALEGVAIAMNINNSRQQVIDLLEQTQAQSEELRVQQEELQQSNEELEERARFLREQGQMNQKD